MVLQKLVEMFKINTGEILASSCNSGKWYFSLTFARKAPDQCFIFQIYGVLSRCITSHGFLVNWNNHSQIL